MPSGDSSASPVVDLLLSRRSLVAEMHVPPGPSPEELDTILRCATRVPDHKRLTPWRIKVYVGEAKARLGRIFQDAYRASHPDASPDELATEAGRPNRSPLLLVVHTHIEDTDKVPRSEQLLSGGAVCQNALIAATALGYAAQWLTEWPAYDRAVTAGIGVRPEDDILGFIYIGTAVGSPKERARPDLEKIVEYVR